jgi:glycosyltransferase involved in cell wall biosynthesis
MNTKVTIGLCAKNSAKILRTAFHSITIQDYSHKLIKLVIVNDNSTDNTLTLAKEFAQETDISTLVISSSGEGLGTARQIVVDNAEGDYIVWIDDDLVLTSDYVKNQVEFMEKNPNVGAARGGYDDVSTNHIVDIINYALLVPSKQSKLKTIGTGGSIFRLKALEKINGFDVQIKGAGEDQDVSHRIRESGWKLAINDSSRLHQKYPPTTPKSLWKKNFGYGYGNHFLFHKYKNQKSLMQYFPPFALLVGLRMTRQIYRVTKMKKVFVFSILYSFAMFAQSIGFERSHLDEYGHVKKI